MNEFASYAASMQYNTLATGGTTTNRAGESSHLIAGLGGNSSQDGAPGSMKNMHK